jgi:hypothetical protein
LDRSGRRNQTCIDGDTLAETLDRSLTLGDDAIYRLAGFGLRPLPSHFEHLFKTLDMALCLFAVCHERLRKLRHLGRLDYLGKSAKNLLSRAVNILQLRQNKPLSVFSPWESPSDM